MSKFSGKCDFGDSVEMFSTPEEVLKSEIYVGNFLIKVDTPDDLIPLYPFLDSGSQARHFLSSKSYIDIEEDEHIDFIMQDAVRLLRKAKKNKEPFDMNFCAGNASIILSDRFIWGYFCEELPKHPDLYRCPTTRKYLGMVRQQYCIPLHTGKGNSYREMLVNHAAETSFGELYKLRGDAFRNAVYKYNQSVEANENLIASYFGEGDKTKPIAMDINTTKYRYNALLHDNIKKIDEYNGLVKKYGYGVE